nr:immunoglobulin heavy chain junction region [Macaca mulatta]MOX58723.1 immunoglobulin heavy chain junction region [Macaca mulatta]MOX58890.1 immunoglobulin heavy chain junction region [Macaca mulatta]MOX59107.1 immunoglobulin heavy chain junction region [Macaca mulatta]MOX59195.1 immunoglobulin heavy chain junction region [Macaca mulatta]
CAVGYSGRWNNWYFDLW